MLSPASLSLAPGGSQMELEGFCFLTFQTRDLNRAVPCKRPAAGVTSSRGLFAELTAAHKSGWVLVGKESAPERDNDNRLPSWRAAILFPSGSCVVDLAHGSLRARGQGCRGGSPGLLSAAGSASVS